MQRGIHVPKAFPSVTGTGQRCADSLLFFFFPEVTLMGAGNKMGAVVACLAAEGELLPADGMWLGVL